MRKNETLKINIPENTTRERYKSGKIPPGKCMHPENTTRLLKNHTNAFCQLDFDGKWVGNGIHGW